MFLSLVVLAVVCQLIPIDRNNPPVTAAVQVPQELRRILSRACFDCHSHETVWPWYSRIAPASWLVAIDVHEGRHHLNFSTWGDYPQDKQQKLRKKIWESVREGEMPPFQYLPLHPEARLNEQEKAMILGWAGIPEGQ
jgi:hypothetical protein